MKTTLSVIFVSFITGCSTIGPPEPQPIRPILTFDGTGKLEYYGPQTPPAPDARVQLAKTIVDGVARVSGIAGGVYAATEVASTIAGAGKYVTGPTNSTSVVETSNTVEAIEPTVVTTDRAVPIEPVIVRPEIISGNL